MKIGITLRVRAKTRRTTHFTRYLNIAVEMVSLYYIYHLRKQRDLVLTGQVTAIQKSIKTTKIYIYTFYPFHIYLSIRKVFNIYYAKGCFNCVFLYLRAFKEYNRMINNKENAFVA